MRRCPFKSGDSLGNDESLNEITRTDTITRMAMSHQNFTSRRFLDIGRSALCKQLTIEPISATTLVSPQPRCKYHVIVGR
jgi:hypothetical protein